MSAATALRLARAANVSVSLDGHDLLLEAACAPPGQIVEMISRYKSDVIALVRPAEDGWAAADWQAFFGERLRIAECRNSMPTQEAAVLAFEDSVVRWLARNPVVPSESGRCLECHRGDERAIV